MISNSVDAVTNLEAESKLKSSKRFQQHTNTVNRSSLITLSSVEACEMLIETLANDCITEKCHPFQSHYKGRNSHNRWSHRTEGAKWPVYALEDTEIYTIWRNDQIQ